MATATLTCRPTATPTPAPAPNTTTSKAPRSAKPSPAAATTSRSCAIPTPTSSPPSAPARAECCQRLPAYDTTRNLSAIQYAHELVLAAAQPNKRQDLEFSDHPVPYLSSVSELIATDYPVVIGKRLATYCTQTGGTLLPPSNRPAEVRRTGLESVTYGCKRSSGDFAFSVNNISSRPNALSYVYNIVVYEAKKHFAPEFKEYAKHIDVTGF